MIVNEPEYRVESESETQRKLRKTKSDKETFEIISWLMFALTLIPFFPGKLLFSSIGIITGWLIYDNYNGSKSAFYANLVSLILRAIMWGFMLMLPLLFWGISILPKI